MLPTKVLMSKKVLIECRRTNPLDPEEATALDSRSCQCRGQGAAKPAALMQSSSWLYSVASGRTRLAFRTCTLSTMSVHSDTRGCLLALTYSKVT